MVVHLCDKLFLFYFLLRRSLNYLFYPKVIIPGGTDITYVVAAAIIAIQVNIIKIIM